MYSVCEGNIYLNDANITSQEWVFDSQTLWMDVQSNINLQGGAYDYF